jgi:hypothetical protein
MINLHRLKTSKLTVSCPRLGYYAALKKKVFLSDFFTLEHGTDRLFRNVGKELQLYAA